MALALKINGEERRFDHSLTVREMLIHLGLDPSKIAVERNLAIVPHSSYGDIRLGEGDRIEIVHFIGGGNARIAKQVACAIKGRKVSENPCPCLNTSLPCFRARSSAVKSTSIA